MNTTIAFVTYETHFAPCGGIAAVMASLPGYIQKAGGLKTIVFTPFHRHVEKTASREKDMEVIGRVNVPFEARAVTVDVCRYTQDWDWYFLKPDDADFFAGRRHPYDVDSSILIRDALFFCAAVVRALSAIDEETSWKLMLQDWEAAATALATAQEPKKYRCFLTMHNSYDAGIGDDDLRRVGIEPILSYGTTVLQRALPHVGRPVFTVSAQFARDITDDFLQATILAPHLKNLLKPRLVGIDNGVFARSVLSEQLLIEIIRGEIKPLQQWKEQRRAEAYEALDTYVPSADKPLWGDLGLFKRDDAPWFVLAGRDDPRQKGYDVAAAAISRFLEEGGSARFLFFPIPGDEGIEGLGFLKKLAAEFPDSIIVLPFLFREGFFAALQGAAYGIMPSIYEPFGMGNEFYLNGTVGIGRATGGIIEQIVPLRGAAAFSKAVEMRATPWHSLSVHPTGILYREPDDIASARNDWIRLNAGAYGIGEGGPDRVEERSQYRLFQAMVDELVSAIRDGVRVYQETPYLYHEMLGEGIRFIMRTFSWERTAQEYVRYINEDMLT